MDDLDLVREFRADLPPARPADLARGRARLSAAMRPATARRRATRILLPAGAVATAAVAAVVGLTLAGTFSSTPPSTPVAAPTSAPQAVPAARLLADASAALAAQPDVEPAPGQWIYTNSISYDYPDARSTDPEWITFDGNETAYIQNGQLVIHKNTDPVPPGAPYAQDYSPKTSYEAMAALPADPKALLAYVDKQMAGENIVELMSSSPLGFYAAKDTTPQREFDYLTGLLWQSQRAAPPSALAAVFKAMATIPGITTQSNVPDDTGTPTVAISANGGLTRMLLDPATYRVRGAQSLSNGTNPVKLGNGKPPSTPWPPRGQIAGSLTIAQASLVSGPGKTS